MSPIMQASVGPHPDLNCPRREFLRTGGGLAVAGSCLPVAWRAADGQAIAETSRSNSAGAKSCILVYLLGGPPHQDTFDLKPDAPSVLRGPFTPIATNAAGIRICEHLPRLATLAHHYALVRSVSHGNSDHPPMIYYTLTGRHTSPLLGANEVRPPQPTDYPHMGAVLARFKGCPDSMPGFIAVPDVATRSSTQGEYKRSPQRLRGGGAGFLGSQFDPLAISGPPDSPGAIPALTLPAEMSIDRFEKRAALLSLLDQRGPVTAATQQQSDFRQQAVALTGTANHHSSQLFCLDGEHDNVRDRYGRHRFGQSMLMSRRLVEAQVRMVAIHWNEMTICDGWDTHKKNFDALRTELLPMLDQGLSALIEDLDDRNMLEDTLVVVMGEFGRTPKINRNAGRDHWGACSSTLFAGGGIRGGQVYGASDSHAAYPALNPVDPVDIQASIYRCMGLDPNQTIMYDQLQRPLPLSSGQAIAEII